MIMKISARITTWLIKMGAIEEEDEALMQYASYSLFLAIAPVFIALAWSCVFRSIESSIIMMVPFMAMRTFSGGYHLKSAKLCFVVSTILLGASIYISKVLQNVNCDIAIINLVIVALLSLYINSPIDSEARKLNENEVKVFGQIVRILCVTILIVLFVLVITLARHIWIPFSVGIILTAALQIPVLIHDCHAKYVRKMSKDAIGVEDLAGRK